MYFCKCFQIVIRVTEVNDNSPKFVGNGKPIVAVVPRHANFGHPVTTVEATDNDIGVNAEIRYSLLNEPSRLFGIDDTTGRIRVLGPITGDSRVFGFDVKATDRRGAEDGRSAIANVFVSRSSTVCRTCKVHATEVKYIFACSGVHSGRQPSCASRIIRHTGGCGEGGQASHRHAKRCNRIGCANPHARATSGQCV